MLNNRSLFDLLLLFQALAQKSDLEERMMTLEKRYVRSQNDLSAAADDSEKLRAEILSLQSVMEQVIFMRNSFILLVFLLLIKVFRWTK